MSQAFQPISGPRQTPPTYGLLQAANVPNSGVTIVTDVTDGTERWGLGVAVWPELVDAGGLQDPTLGGTSAVPKGFGEDQPGFPEVSPFMVWIAESCKAAVVHNDQAGYRARAVRALEVVQGGNVELELLTGSAVSSNPHLSDGLGTFPNGDIPTSAVNGLAILEAEIGRSKRSGLIHVSPQVATFLHNNGLIEDRGGVVRTVNGTTVINGAGYTDGATPHNHQDPVGWEEWIYATGPIEIRRTEVIVIPDTLAEALDRSLGATNDDPNVVTYVAERYYLVDYDQVVQAAVLVDRCTTECGTPPS